MSKRRRSRSKGAGLVRRWVGIAWQLSAQAVGLLRRTLVRLYRRLRTRGPTVIIDARRRQARRLRREIARAARAYARALGAELPPGLLVVVQRVVHEGRQLNGLLQAFEGADGSRRYVVHLALSVNGRQVSEDELLAALRHQLTGALEDTIGKPALNVPLDLEVPHARVGASVVELRPEARGQQDGQERTAAHPTDGKRTSVIGEQEVNTDDPTYRDQEP
jgi:hypothetical protein